MTEEGDSVERERLSRRIHLITGTETARALRRYRTQINKRTEILKRQVDAIPVETAKGLRYRASDEVALLHVFLDQQGIA